MKISDLLKVADDFYNKALWHYSLTKSAQSTYVSPDDEDEEDNEEEESRSHPELGLYDKIVNMSNNLRDRDLSQELELIAELYGKSIQLGAGYNTVNKGISNLINMSLDDEDNPEYEDVEDLLNEVSGDLRKRAGGGAALAKPDSPEIVAQLKSLRQNFNQELAKKTIEELHSGNTFEAQMGGLSNYDEKATGVFDFSGGVGKEEGDKSGRGYHTERGNKPLKDWVLSYKNEQERYQDLLDETKDPKRADKLKQLIATLGVLQTKTEEQDKLTKEQLVLLKPDPEIEKKIAINNANLDKLKEQRRVLKLGIRNSELEKTYDLLEEEKDSSKDPKEKFLLDQQMKLNELLRTRFLNRGPETKLRKFLIKTLKGGSLGESTLKNILDKINEAAKLKKPFEEYQKEEAAQIKDQKKTIDIVDPLTGKKKTFTDWANVEIEGYKKHFQQSIANERSEVKKNVRGRILSMMKDNAQLQAIYEKLLTTVAENSVKKDKSLAEAVGTLRTQLKSDMIKDTSFVDFAISVRASKFFYKYLEKIKILEKLKIDKKQQLSSEESQFLSAMISEGKQLLTYYGKRSSFAGDPRRKAYYATNQVRILRELIPYLEGILSGDENE